MFFLFNFQFIQPTIYVVDIIGGNVRVYVGGFGAFVFYEILN